MVVSDVRTGAVEVMQAKAVIFCTGGYGRIFKITMFDQELHGPADTRFTGLAQQLHRIRSSQVQQMQVFGLFSLIDLVEREALARHQIQLLTLAHVLNLGAQSG